MIFAFIIIGVIMIGVSFKFIGKSWSIFTLPIGTCLFMFSVIGSICSHTSFIEQEVHKLTIAEGKKAIYVETEYGDFKLTELKDRELLSAEKVIVVTPKNAWGIELSKSKYVEAK